VGLLLAKRFVFQPGVRFNGGTERIEEKRRVEGACDGEARNTSRALPGSEKESRESSAEVEYDKTSIPLMETNPPLRALSPRDAPADNL